MYRKGTVVLQQWPSGGSDICSFCEIRTKPLQNSLDSNPDQSGPSQVFSIQVLKTLDHQHVLETV